MLRDLRETTTQEAETDEHAVLFEAGVAAEIAKMKGKNSGIVTKEKRQKPCPRQEKERIAGGSRWSYAMKWSDGSHGER